MAHCSIVHGHGHPSPRACSIKLPEEGNAWFGRVGGTVELGTVSNSIKQGPATATVTITHKSVKGDHNFGIKSCGQRQDSYNANALTVT
jgi:hypothetical protein